MKFLLITPPFTQLNTPYPATSYIKGFLNTLGIESIQADLGLDIILSIFTKSGLDEIFFFIEEQELDLSDNAFRIFSQRNRYKNTIEPIISFLQNKNQTLAHTICAGGYLPQASRFSNTEDLDWAFGSMGTHDKARHMATLYLEDLGDLITETIDSHFGFSRYAERLARTASNFDDLYDELQKSETLVTRLMLEKLEEYFAISSPDVVCITAPFPGNVFGAFKCGQFIHKRYPNTKVVFGGGYVNTELRRVYDERVFEFMDFICLDDGEAPLQHLIQYVAGSRHKDELKRTFCLESGVVSYKNGSKEFDIPQSEVGTPDYSDLRLQEYLSVIEVVNPMHRLWSDGRWNKLTLAHGCYWGKCSFCDVSLDYIKRYEPISASILCDRIEEIINQTGQNGFHFVDEAAPPALMRDVAIEILKRQITIVWWTNIRFEKSFSPALCTLLRASGCIAVSGGLEVASDRLLEKMKKGVTVAQVARVADAFTTSGIMVHAYLMYGFPTQTAQETIDSLEMVRQMFEAGIIQSGFWHQFAMTAHSPVGLDPAAYGVKFDGPSFGGFAENDYFHQDKTGADHEKYSEGLKVSLYNYLQATGLDEDLNIWFDFAVPETTMDPDYIHIALSEKAIQPFRTNDIVLWIGGSPIEMIVHSPKKVKKNVIAEPIYAEIIVSGVFDNYSLFFEHKTAEWVLEVMQESTASSKTKNTMDQLKASYNAYNLMGFDDFICSEAFATWKEAGLLIL